MPLLSFSCRHCGDTFDLFLSWSQARKPVACPTCKSPNVERAAGTKESAAPPTGGGCSLSKKS
jgi:putative FmdB family regulatory protein